LKRLQIDRSHLARWGRDARLAAYLVFGVFNLLGAGAYMAKHNTASMLVGLAVGLFLLWLAHKDLVAAGETEVADREAVDS
jgi:threonine/homoserine/homoserine lactone efflux protein